MSRWRPSILATAALAASVVCIAAAARGAEVDSAAVGRPLEFLASPADLDAVNLSIVDDKLALSLAVEIHVQIELTEFAVKGVQHDALRQLTLRKLALYHRLLDTMDNLSGGRATATLSRSLQGRDAVPQSTTAEAELPGGQQPSATASQAVGQDSTAAARSDNPRAPRRTAKRGGGISNIIQNAATAAIMRVRLEIAEQYGGMLRAELASTPPAEFDRHYLAIEVFNQMQVMAMLRVFEQQASADFARILHVATAAAEAQFAEAHQVIEILKRLPQTVPLVPAPLAPMPLVNAVETSGS